MAQDDKQYFVDVTVSWGKQNGESQKAESVGGQNWGYLTYDQSVGVQSFVVEAIKKMLDDAVEVGLMGASDQTMVDAIKAAKAAKAGK